jgi:hypothetical protein
MPPNKALQPPANSAFRLASGSLPASTYGWAARVGGEIVRRTIGATVILVGLLLGGSAEAESQPSAIVDAYLKGLVAGNSSAAFDALMTHSRIDEIKPREIALVKGQIDQGIALYGKPSAFESVSRKPYGSSIVRLIYITKHSDVALVWNFYFYRATDDWQLLNFDFNDQLQKLD